MIKPEGCIQNSVDVSVGRSYYRDLIKLYRHSKDCVKKTFLESFTSGSKNGTNQTIIDKHKDASKSKGETIEVSSPRFTANRSRKDLSCQILIIDKT